MSHIPLIHRQLTLERLPSVRARTALSRSEIYRRIRNGTFPAPIKIGERASAWDSREIDAHIQSQIDTRKVGAR
jgi:prophage regulatory protein